MVDEPEAVERGISCWHLPGPENERNTIYSGPPGGVFWVSADAREPEAASQLLHRMSTREFQAALARAMDQPPAMLEVVEERSEEHTSELQSRGHLVCRLLLEK